MVRHILFVYFCCTHTKNIDILDHCSRLQYIIHEYLVWNKKTNILFLLIVLLINCF